MEVSSIIFIVSAIILIGFAARLAFKWTSVPTSVVLILIGILLGPVLGLFDRAMLVPVAPVFGTIALLLILFEGGLELDIKHVIQSLKPAFVLGLLTFFLSAFVGSIALIAFSDIPTPVAILFGCIIGGTSPAVVIPTLQPMLLHKNLKTTLVLESAITEMLTVVSVVLAMDSITSGSAMQLVFAPGHVIWGVGIAAAIGVVLGVVWVPVLSRFGKEPLMYMVTLAVVFATYVVAEKVGAHGVIAVLCFGLILANTEWLKAHVLPFLTLWTTRDVSFISFDLDHSTQRMNTEMSFLVRTFFFVYTGMIIDIFAFGLSTIAYTVGLVVALVGVRYLSVSILRNQSESFSTANGALVALFPRGLATIVMAFSAVTAGIPRMESVLQLVFAVVLLTNVGMALTLVFLHKIGKRQDQEIVIE